MKSSVEDKKKLARRIERLLRKEYGEPPKRKAEDPINVLVRTILSQNTTDTNSRRAFDTLKMRFPDWNAVRLAPARKIERAIRIGGIARVKARRIKKILSQIHASYDRISLQPLCEMTAKEASTALLAFEGVGPKTVNCVLLFGCGMDALPVDTHILRISKRLGLIPESASLVRAHGLWARFLPGKLAYSLHLNLIAHGRRICRSRKPVCLSCCLRRVCRSDERLAQFSRGKR